MKKWKWILLVIAATFLIVLFGSGGYVYEKTTSTIEEIQVPVKATGDEEVDQEKPVSFLLLGVDQRANEAGRSDTMIVVTVDPKTNESKMLSIPRDLKTEIVGMGTEDKVNHAFAFGGPNMAIETVENLLDIPINYYIEINMAGFMALVDAVGGVTVDNAFAFSYYEMQFPEGKIKLDGRKALTYARMRYDDPRGDFGRQIRQRQVMMAVAEKLTKNVSVERFNKVLGVLGKNVRTNVSFSAMRKLAMNYNEAARSLETLRFEGKGGVEADGVYYWHPDPMALKELQQTLKNSLE
ncbi:LCP family glycopolymer transferase [Exiguobacterium flavidum]|uniref:LCP family glycopolymer transferase n=1 Tax=Exiguobacterium flavidum TaxID=2184695 RepID=UPI000DF725B5|nr:LCP family protein [Exiguobacterium flavidum]